MAPTNVSEDFGIDVGPHPHIGLQTVTWLLEGEALHRDSLGTEQVVRPGQLNLMTAGYGVAHSEEATGHYRGRVHGVQLWVAQPDRTRNGAPAFEHHPDLPLVELDRCRATVLVGELLDSRSSARHDTALVGLDLDLRNGVTELPLQRDFEYAVVVLDGAVWIDGVRIMADQLAYLVVGRADLSLRSDGPTRALVLGGEPLKETVVMWWNFVGRDRSEFASARQDWENETDRFPSFYSPLARIAAPPLL